MSFQLTVAIIAALVWVSVALVLSAMDPGKDMKPEPRYHPRRDGMIDWSFWPEEEKRRQRQGWPALRKLLWIGSASLFLAVLVIYFLGY